MLAGNRVCSPLSDAPKQTAWRSGSELERMQANMGEMGQYQTSELGVGDSNPSRCAILRLMRRQTLDTGHGIETLIKREDAMETMTLHHSQVNCVFGRQGWARRHDIFRQQHVCLADRKNIVNNGEERIE